MLLEAFGYSDDGNEVTHFSEGKGTDLEMLGLVNALIQSFVGDAVHFLI